MKFINFLVFSFLFSLSLNAQWEKTNATFGGNVNSMEVIGEQIYSCTDLGVFVSNDDGETWVEKNNGLPKKAVYSIISKGTNIFIGTAGNGVYCSQNKGETWFSVNKGIVNTDVRALYVFGNSIYAGTESDGVFMSTNDGTTWSASSNGLINSPFRCFIQFNQKLYVGSYGSGVFVLDNLTKNWKATNDINSNNSKINLFVNSLAVEINTEEQLYVGTDEGLFKTNVIRAGYWIKMQSFPIKCLKIYGNQLYSGTSTLESDDIYTSKKYTPPSGYFGILTSNNGGETWTNLNKGLSYNQVTSFIIKQSTFLAGTIGTGIYKSINNGNLWYLVNKGVIGNTKVNCLKVDNNIVYAGTDGAGIYKSVDGGKTWIQINNGLIDYKITNISITNSILFAGTETRGIFRSLDGGTNWEPCIIESLITKFRDDAYLLFPVRIKSLHITDNGFIYLSVDGPQGERGICYSSDNGNTWVSTNLYVDGPKISDITSDNTNIYSISNSNSSNNTYLMSSFIGNSFWKNNLITNNLIPYKIQILDTMIYIIGYRDLVVSNDNGQNWRATTGNFITDDGYEGKILNISLNNYYTNLTCLLKSEKNKLIFVGTEDGVYFTSNKLMRDTTIHYKDLNDIANNKYSPTNKINDGLLDTSIVSIGLDDFYVYVSTNKGTIWRRSLNDIMKTPASSGLIEGPNIVCQSQKSVEYKVQPIKGATSYIWSLPNSETIKTKTNSLVIDLKENILTGDLVVKGVNYFGEGLSSTLKLTINSTPAPSGNSIQTLCNGAKLSDIDVSGSNIKWYDENKVLLTDLNTYLETNKTYFASQSEICESSLLPVKVILTNEYPDPTITSNNFIDNSTNTLFINACDGDKVKLKVNSIQGLIYQWQLNNINIDGAKSSELTVDKPGEYGIIIKNPSAGKNCISTNFLILNINSKPSVSIKADGNTNISLGEAVNLVIDNYSFNNKYEWFNNGVKVPETGFNWYSANTSGTYSVLATNENKCSIYSNQIEVTVSSNASIQKNDKSLFNLYPNPITEVLTVELPDEYVNAKFKVIDVSGKELVKGNLNTTMNTINLERLASGTYFLEIGNEYRTKFIKQ